MEKTWRMTKKEWLLEGAAGILLGLAVNLLFYRSLWALLLLPPLTFGYLRFRLSQKKKARAQCLRRDFRQALSAFSASLEAGHAVENAFPDVTAHLRSVCGENAEMTQAFHAMEGQIKRMQRPATCLRAFADKTGDADIRRFATIFAIAEERGGPLVQIVRDASREIGEKIAIEEEIATALAGKKYEQRIMAVMPALLIVYMQLASPGFLDVLYTGVFGRAVMTAALAVYLFAFLWGSRIAEVAV